MDSCEKEIWLGDIVMAMNRKELSKTCLLRFSVAFLVELGRGTWLFREGKQEKMRTLFLLPGFPWFSAARDTPCVSVVFKRQTWMFRVQLLVLQLLLLTQLLMAVGLRDWIPFVVLRSEELQALCFPSSFKPLDNSESRTLSGSTWVFYLDHTSAYRHS